MTNLHSGGRETAEIVRQQAVHRQSVIRGERRGLLNLRDLQSQSLNQERIQQQRPPGFVSSLHLFFYSSKLCLLVTQKLK